MTIEASVFIENSNPHEAFDAILDESMAQFWMPFPFVIEPHIGGYITFRRDKWSEPATGFIGALGQASFIRLNFRGAMTGMAMLELTSQPKGVTVTVHHDGAFDEAECAEVWDKLLGRLKEYLETLTPG